MKRKYLLLTILSLLSSCDIIADRKQEVLMTDKDYVQFARAYSPDHSMILMDYGIDEGAFGYGHAGTAILKLNDTTKNLRLFTLPNLYDNVKWLTNKSVTAEYDIVADLRSHIKSDLSNKEINGVNVNITARDYICANCKIQIEQDEVSPDGKYRLVAYRYSFKEEFSPIHISILPVGDLIPKYGNFYIGTKESDYILNGVWSKNNELLFYTNNSGFDMVQYYFVESGPDIKYHVITDDKKYSGKYLWSKDHGHEQ